MPRREPLSLRPRLLPPRSERAPVRNSAFASPSSARHSPRSRPDPYPLPFAARPLSPSFDLTCAFSVGTVFSDQRVLPTARSRLRGRTPVDQDSEPSKEDMTMSKLSAIIFALATALVSLLPGISEAGKSLNHNETLLRG